MSILDRKLIHEHLKKRPGQPVSLKEMRIASHDFSEVKDGKTSFILNKDNTWPRKEYPFVRVIVQGDRVMVNHRMPQGGMAFAYIPDMHKDHPNLDALIEKAEKGAHQRFKEWDNRHAHIHYFDKDGREVELIRKL